MLIKRREAGSHITEKMGAKEEFYKKAISASFGMFCESHKYRLPFVTSALIKYPRDPVIPVLCFQIRISVLSIFSWLPNVLLSVNAGEI
ncbi:hypothetical protein CDAR_195801 [Caerostris darwini]|uniref:Uncharacterized protein n=1 Tax=Caerostris darwini TaxID=1538125 RepID=A0AAV4QZF9_9ARAC|nr:hypothetical protein CDAR_195801 [Caerostris darwini]